MRPHLFLLLFLPGLHAAAQVPVIGPAEFFQVGGSYHRDTYDIPPDEQAEMVAANGINYLVDLTWVNTAPHYTTDSIACTAAPSSYLYFSDYYDTANVLLTITDLAVNAISEYLFLVAPDTVRYVGGQPNGAWATGDDLVFQRYIDYGFERLLLSDMTFATTWTDIIHSRFLDASGSDDHFQNGTATTLVDGYGTVLLPDGAAIANTLRVRTVFDYEDVNVLFGTTEHHDTLYTWWAEGVSGPLMTLPIGHYGMMHGYVNPLPFTLYRQNAFVSITEHPNAAPVMFPNPCTDRLCIGGMQPGTPYRLFDGTGHCTRSGVLDAAGALPTGTLAPGLYLLQAGRAPRVRVVVQR